MECKNHTGVAALDRCAGCAEPFCFDCLVEIHGQKYCGSCKVMALKHPLTAGAIEPTVPCKEAGEALTWAIFGLFCFGFILGPIAISKASKAKALIASDPTLSGSGKATAAIVIGSLAILFWVLNLIMRVANID